MPRYVALLRAINVGGHGVVKMTALARAFEALGLESVRTYIQSGNVLFESRRANRKLLTSAIEKSMQRALHRPTTAFVLSPEELAAAVAHNPFDVEDEQQACHVMFLSAAPARKNRSALMALEGEDYRFCVQGRILYYAYPRRLAGRRRTIDFEKVLGVLGTARNSKVVEELVRLSNAS